MFKFEKVEMDKSFYKGDSQIDIRISMRGIGLNTKIAVEETFMAFLDEVYKKLKETDEICQN